MSEFAPYEHEPSEVERAHTEAWLRRKRGVYGHGPEEDPNHESINDASFDRYSKGQISFGQYEQDVSFNEAHRDIYEERLKLRPDQDPSEVVSFDETIDLRRIRAGNKLLKMVTLAVPDAPPHKRRGMPENVDEERWNQEIIMAFTADEHYPRGDGDIWLDPSDETLVEPTFNHIVQDIIDAKLHERVEADLALIAMLYRRDGIRPEMMIQYNEQVMRNQLRFTFLPRSH